MSLRRCSLHISTHSFLVPQFPGATCCLRCVSRALMWSVHILSTSLAEYWACLPEKLLISSGKLLSFLLARPRELMIVEVTSGKRKGSSKEILTFMTSFDSYTVQYRICRNWPTNALSCILLYLHDGSNMFRQGNDIIRKRLGSFWFSSTSTCLLPNWRWS
jgi:hypothetical protein